MTLRGNEKLPFEIMKETHVIKIASGADHIVFLTIHGDIYTCGCPEQGQLGRITERGSSRNARSGIGKGQIGMEFIIYSVMLYLQTLIYYVNIFTNNSIL